MPTSKQKTIYFPDKPSKNAGDREVHLSFEESSAYPDSLIEYVERLSGREIRLILGNPSIEELHSESEDSSRSLEEICLDRIYQKIGLPTGQSESIHQTKLPTGLPQEGAEEQIGLTFQDSKEKAVHRWYPYVEGFSADYVRSILLPRKSTIESVYDPFGGCGTVQLEASILGIPSFYSELNPLGRFITDTKINHSRRIKNDYNQYREEADQYLQRLGSESWKAAANETSLDSYRTAFPDRDYFQEEHLRHLLASLNLADRLSLGEPLREMIRLAVASNTVAASKMTRRADLRRRREDEYQDRTVDVPEMIRSSLEEYMVDIESIPSEMAGSTFIGEDAKNARKDHKNSFDLALTSPPYLNGTNYFRNTKLELWILEFIESEDDLSDFREKSITAGINSASRTYEGERFEPVEEIASELDDCAYDARIPSMIRGYFADMFEVLTNVYQSLSTGGTFVLDIGDSKYAGVHVPTDQILTELAEKAGFEAVRSRQLAKRYSRDKTELVQVELLFEKNGRVN